MEKNLLELWGRTLMEMAKMARGSQGFFELFQDGFAKKESKSNLGHHEFIDLCQKMFGKEGVETFNAIMSEFYKNAGVVPRTQYNELNRKYSDLKKKVGELEEKIDKLKKRFGGETDVTTDLINQMSEVVDSYADINRQFFKEFSRFFEK